MKFAPTEGHYKIYIIDEVHMLTTEAFNALLKTLEEPPERVIFILATTEPHKVPATIQSRCQRYDFHRITVTEIRDRLLYVCKESDIAAEEDALDIIAAQADGGMRDALSILDQCMALAEGTLTAERVQEALGLVGRAWIRRMAGEIAARDAAALIAQLSELLQSGRELKQVLAELAQYFRQLMIAGVGGAVSAAELCAGDAEELRMDAAQFTQEEIMAILRRLNETMQELRTSPQPRIAVETLLIGLCHTEGTAPSGESTAPPTGGADAARIARLEAQVEELAARLAAGGTPISASASATASAAPSPRPREAKADGAAAKPAPKKAASSAAKEAADGAPRQLDMKVWQSFQTRLKERNRLAASLLSGAAYEGMTETHFFIRPSSDMARDYIKKRHRAVFDEVMTELAGRPLAVVCTGGEEEELPPPPPPKEPDYPAPVAALLEVAGEGARVEEVTAPPRAAQKKPATHPQESAAKENDYEPYEPTPDEEAEMFDDELPPDA